jgi:NAD(P)-dependent dehydrogenase (short-subunit alcohol dehydrogenase family)
MSWEPNVPDGLVDRLFDLTGKIALVTGGGSGLGEAVALGYAQAGARVVVADIDEDKAARVARACADGRGSSHHVDVTSRVSVEALVGAVVADHRRIDVLFNSAGTARRHPAEDFPEDEWDLVVGLNLKGSWLVAQAVGRQMLAQGGGAIVNVASIGASIAYPHTTAYLQSKGGVAQMTRSLALEWVDRGVRVNAVAPSIFETPLVLASDRVTSITSDFIAARTPIGRRGKPHEIVGPAVFLASDAASMVTGHLLQVDGGYLIA